MGNKGSRSDTDRDQKPRRIGAIGGAGRVNTPEERKKWVADFESRTVGHHDLRRPVPTAKQPFHSKHIDIGETPIIPEGNAEFSLIDPPVRSPRPYSTSTLISEKDSISTILNSIVEFFPLIFTKVQSHPEKYSKYVARTSSMIINETRYIIVITMGTDDLIGEEVKFSDLLKEKILSIQTRTAISDTYKIGAQSYVGHVSKTNPLNEIIDLEGSTKDKSIYISRRYPLRVELLHKGKSEHEFADKLSLISAIESFNCIITFDV